MQGKVSVAKLNVRAGPGIDASPIGILLQDAVVGIVGENDEWYEIDYIGKRAFASRRYIDPIAEPGPLTARVKPQILNVRDEPGMSGSVIGQLRRGSRVTVAAQHGGWLEINFNQKSGYISGSHVEITASSTVTQGTVNAMALNVRSAATHRAKVIGSLSLGEKITVRSTHGNWYEIIFNDLSAFVAAKYIRLDENDDSRLIPHSDLSSEEEDSLINIDSTPLAPAELLDTDRSGRSLSVALTWNRYGGLLQQLAGVHNIETACIIAVLCVESSGNGFLRENQGRQIIRFENHKFWKYWGKDHSEKFKQHFSLNLSGKPWLGHQWRNAGDMEWIKFHGNQQREWQVLEFARTLDDTSALLSISMGAPQIMGFHHKKLGYETVQDMFERFNQDIRYHILGLFEFLNPAMLNALRNKDFTKFASYYNGPGQKEKYGKWIKEHYDAFNKIRS
ncbi:MAG: N-acetylmuramidase domain-containing protein [Chromatiales bacterium]|nr:N-acetylmuramidase domain-containing protein [Chromatiales bacterium]